jgi:hypothetical protein
VAENKKLICDKCREDMAPAPTNFTYLGHSFRTEVLCCPTCGQVFIPEDLVKGRMAEVEMMLEDK